MRIGFMVERRLGRGTQGGQAEPAIVPRCARSSTPSGPANIRRPRMLQLHNTLTGRKEPFTPLTPGHVRMYHCGPTVYSSPHIGNFRTFLLADLLRRFLEDQGLQVTQVMNVTDVGHLTADDEDRGEDRMEVAARREKLDPWKIARKYEAEFVAALQALHFRMPHHLPRATEHIKEMGTIIDDLLHKGIAYQKNGNVYFEIGKFPRYGQLSKKPLDELEEGARVAVNPEKKDPRDFALWKVDPKHLMQWDAPFRGGARGFPGWHIECSAMSMKYLGPSFDVHTGGEDNLFPHHECEVAQSEAHTGAPFVRCWLHVKHLLVDGQKMSKSLGNFTTVQQILDQGYSGDELRLALIRVQYRQTLNFTLPGLDDARAAIQRVRHARARLQRIASGQEPAGRDPLQHEIAAADAAFTGALADDLNTSEALAAVFQLVTVVNKAAPSAEGARTALGAFARFAEVLGCFHEAAAARQAPPEVQELLRARQAARAGKQWAESDRLRDEIGRRGWRIVDTTTGPRLEPGT
jgi:cysteinyl-tRNA synthetase